MKIDLHIHTNFSDGVCSPKEAVKAAIERGLDCICITDHDEIRGAIEAMKFGFDKNILVIPGIEITTESGHILGINVKEVIPQGFSMEETIKKIQKKRGLAVIAHPYFGWPVNHFGVRKKNFSLADALEIFNASLFQSLNKKAINFSRANHLFFTAGSDAHIAEFIGRGYIETSGDIFSEEKLLEEIKKGNIKFRGRPLNYVEMLRNNSPKRITRFFLNSYRKRKNKIKKSLDVRF